MTTSTLNGTWEHNDNQCSSRTGVSHVPRSWRHFAAAEVSKGSSRAAPCREYYSNLRQGSPSGLLICMLVHLPTRASIAASFAQVLVAPFASHEHSRSPSCTRSLHAHAGCVKTPVPPPHPLVTNPEGLGNSDLERPPTPKGSPSTLHSQS